MTDDHGRDKNKKTIPPCGSVDDLKLTVSEELTWISNILQVVKRAQNGIRVEQAQIPQNFMLNLLRTATESSLTNCTTMWYTSCTAAQSKDLHYVVKVPCMK